MGSFSNQGTTHTPNCKAPRNLQLQDHCHAVLPICNGMPLQEKLPRLACWFKSRVVICSCLLSLWAASLFASARGKCPLGRCVPFPHSRIFVPNSTPEPDPLRHFLPLRAQGAALRNTQCRIPFASLISERLVDKKPWSLGGGVAGGELGKGGSKIATSAIPLTGFWASQSRVVPALGLLQTRLQSAFGIWGDSFMTIVGNEKVIRR